MSSKTRSQAASTVAAGIAHFENTIDESLIGGAEFVATMLRARQDARLAAAVGHDALEEAYAAWGHALAARRAIVRGHERLDTLRRQLKLPETADGGKLGMPDITGALERPEVGSHASV